MTAAPMRVDTRALVDSPGSTPVSEWPERIALSFALVLFVGVALWAMWRAWRRLNGHDGGLDALPQPPADLGQAIAGPFEARYLATTASDDPKERIIVQGLGVPGVGLLAVTDAGLYLERAGAMGIFLPARSVRGARMDQAIAGSVYGVGGLVVVTWSLGHRRLDTAFRIGSVRRHAELVDAVGVLLANQKLKTHRRDKLTTQRSVASPEPSSTSAPPEAEA